jgi:hypothetical protein
MCLGLVKIDPLVPFDLAVLLRAPGPNVPVHDPSRFDPSPEAKETERETLERWARRAKTAQALAQCARLILGCAAGKTNTVVAYELRVTKQRVGKWRTRFLARRLDGCWMSRGLGPPERSPMHRSSAC